MAEIENVVIIDRFDYDELVEKARMTDEEIKNLLATEDKSLILIATKVGAYLHGTVCFSPQKEYKIGYYSEEWVAFNFTISSDKVVLSNI